MEEGTELSFSLSLSLFYKITAWPPKAEVVAGAKAVLLPDLRGLNDQGAEAAVFDRIFRAASGRFARRLGPDAATIVLV